MTRTKEFYVLYFTLFALIQEKPRKLLSRHSTGNMKGGRTSAIRQQTLVISSEIDIGEIECSKLNIARLRCKSSSDVTNIGRQKKKLETGKREASRSNERFPSHSNPELSRSAQFSSGYSLMIDSLKEVSSGASISHKPLSYVQGSGVLIEAGPLSLRSEQSGDKKTLAQNNVVDNSSSYPVESSPALSNDTALSLSNIEVECMTRSTNQLNDDITSENHTDEEGRSESSDEIDGLLAAYSDVLQEESQHSSIVTRSSGTESPDWRHKSHPQLVLDIRTPIHQSHSNSIASPDEVSPITILYRSNHLSQTQGQFDGCEISL